MSRRRSLGHFDRRGDTFRVRLSVGGARYSFTVRTSDRRVAEREARQRYKGLERQLDRHRRGGVTGRACSELFALFEAQELPTRATGTQRSYRDSLKPIRRFFVEQLGDPLVEQVQARHVLEYLSWRRAFRLDGGMPLSSKTLQKDRAVLHRIFALAEQLEYRDGNPVSRTPTPKGDSREPVFLSVRAIRTSIGSLPRECDARTLRPHNRRDRRAL